TAEMAHTLGARQYVAMIYESAELFAHMRALTAERQHVLADALAHEAGQAVPDVHELLLAAILTESSAIVMRRWLEDRTVDLEKENTRFLEYAATRFVR